MTSLKGICIHYSECAGLNNIRIGRSEVHPPNRWTAVDLKVFRQVQTSEKGTSHLQVEVFCYALSPTDNSEWRNRIEHEAEHFLDVSSWSTADIAGQISKDRVQVAINLNGYTKVLSRGICAFCVSVLVEFILMRYTNSTIEHTEQTALRAAVHTGTDTDRLSQMSEIQGLHVSKASRFLCSPSDMGGVTVWLWG